MKKRAKPGDIVEICSLKYRSHTVTVESITNSNAYEEVPIGTLAIFLGKIKDGANVMLGSGLVGWVFDDEWRLANF